MIFNEGHLSLRQALHMFPDYDAAMKMMSDTLANLRRPAIDDNEND